MRSCHSHELSGDDREVLRDFLVTAFDGDFGDADFDHAIGGVHVLAGAADRLVGHASVVQRQLILGDEVLRTGYVEAVAVDAAMRRQGIGDALMTHVEGIVRRAYEFGALGASDDGRALYLRHGWEPWEGQLGALAPDGVRPTPDEEGHVFILRTPVRPDVDLSARLLCDWRRGEVW
ncbi:GNAT family N-acetyltransferase [Gordonia zhaorongruii]|uniref:GNAT family N-acetyltransferase n=1 Tax=Gordonia zhaorongruii TaxID=2597659 RepID=UPI00104CA223|nr:GNAT family N-acetyltransferase [Gordonia zhaorongruii]